jgi:hypothetical protein
LFLFSFFFSLSALTVAFTELFRLFYSSPFSLYWFLLSNLSFLLSY